MSRNTNSERIPGFDWLRFWAILAVIAIHASDAALKRGQYFPVLTVEGRFWYAFSSCLRFCVPAFLMMSAYLGEARMQKTGDRPALRWKRFAVPLAAATLVYTLVTVLENTLKHRPVSLSTLLIAALTGQSYYHLWFLFTLFVYILLHHVLRVCATPPAFIAIVTACTLLYAMTPGNLERFSTGPLPTALTLLVLSLPYYLAGIWAARNADRLRRLPLFPVVLCAAGGLAASCAYGVLLREHSFFNPGAELLSVAVFLWALRAKAGPPAVVGRIAALSLGLYLWHPLFLTAARFAEGRRAQESCGIGVSFALVLFDTAVALAGSMLFSVMLVRSGRWRALAE